MDGDIRTAAEKPQDAERMGEACGSTGTPRPGS